MAPKSKNVSLIAARTHQLTALSKHLETALCYNINDPLFGSYFTIAQKSYDGLLENTFQLRDLYEQINNPEQYDIEIEPLVQDINRLYATLLVQKSAYDKQHVVPSASATHTIQTVQNVARPLLSPIKISHFDGKDISKWPTFKNLFESLIHNTNISDVEKFHYLHSVLEEPALSLVKTLPIVDANYVVAWGNLVARYDNPRLLATNYVENLFNIKALPKHPDANALQTFCSILSENFEAFMLLNVPDALGFALYCHTNRLIDNSLRLRFEAEIASSNSLPTFTELLKFLQRQCQILQAARLSTQETFKAASPSTKVIKRNTFHVDTNNSTKQRPQCPYCTESHFVSKCPIFLKMSPGERYDSLTKQKQKYCFNCLAPNHFTGRCNSTYNCKKCNKRHHTLLHESEEPTEVADDAGGQQSVSHHVSSETSVILGTAMAQIEDNFGKLHPIRILIDNGSSCSIITTKLAKKLGLKKEYAPVQINTVGQIAVSKKTFKVRCKLQSNRTSHIVVTTDALILPKITCNLPNAVIPQQTQNKFKRLPLADPCFWECRPIDFLLGADLYSEAMNCDVMTPIYGKPSAIPSIFGYVILGKVENSSQNNFNVNFVQTENVTSSLSRFWELEEPKHKPIKNPEDKLAEEHFLKTHSRDNNGRYVVALPFKQEPPSFEDSRHGAEVRLKNLERKLSKDEALHKTYTGFLQEYLDLGHMSLAPQPGKYFIPHHGVFKAHDMSGKIRVVFDASCVSKNSSLNQHLLAGPKLQLEISDILTKFRLHPIVFSADITKMYRQILVKAEHRAYQHILWRSSPDKPILEYELNTVTYGVTSAPFLAIRVLHQLVNDEGHRFPAASQALLESIYVDDIVAGGDSIEQTRKLQMELVELLKCGGFELRKWTSNCAALLKDVPIDHRESPITFLDSENESFKILGVRWEPKDDVFSYHVSKPKTNITKRSVLSTIASIYDPNGWIAPIIFAAKGIFQETWLSKITWDDPLPDELANRWKHFVDHIEIVSNIKIPRFVLTYRNSSIFLCGFCDASEKGYSACVYLKSGESCFLLTSKTRVAPLKTRSIPRLELCGAVLLVEVLEALKPSLKKIQVEKTYLFTDSTIVLSWINMSPHLLKTFVSNRIAEIQRCTLPTNWYHVVSAENPADMASRGVSPEFLVNNKQWWNGPEWLSKSIGTWPLVPSAEFTKTTTLEQKTVKPVLVVNIQQKELLEDFERFSTFSKLQRVYAYVIRFKHNLKHPNDRKQGPLSVSELNAATEFFTKILQSFHFKDEIKTLQNNETPKVLAKLMPFLDDKGLLRVGGRLQKSPLSFEGRHPVLLPTKSHMTNLIIEHYHKVHLHAGPQLLQALIHQKFWIPNARRVIRNCIFRCMPCYRLKAKGQTTLMGNLPKSRFEQGRPFLNVGTDFAGPFNIKTSPRRNAPISKAYLCVFICMATKAVHLELVSSLSTEAFLATLDRFIARRGCPTQIHSDNGTNFVGAAREFRNLFRENSYQQVISDHLAKRQITWHFIPPAAPHHGGIWEACVKSAKSHLKRIAGERAFTFEELTTLFSKIEAVLNSRPLCPLSSSPDEVDFLSPGHFIIGAHLQAAPEQNLSDENTNLLSRWQLVHQAAQHFWKRWSVEYLHTLQQRAKWTQRHSDLKVDDMVLIIDPTSPPLHWKMGRVQRVHPGNDKITRVVTVKTAQGSYKRSITKVVPLPSTQ